MSLVNISHGFGKGVGTLAVTSRKVLSLPGCALCKAIGSLRSASPKADVRTIVAEELTRLMGAEALTEEKLEQRLKVFAETILALHERLDELAVSGPISQVDLLGAMDSLKPAETLTNDEKNVLVNVFRQNIALQKPELADTAADTAASE